MLGVAAAAGVSIAGAGRSLAAASGAAHYLNTYSSAYKTAAGEVGAAGTFYGVGGQASIALAFSDAIWAKYELGAYTGLKDASGKPYTRNVFNRPTPTIFTCSCRQSIRR
jgi:hypothetical protein